MKNMTDFLTMIGIFVLVIALVAGAIYFFNTISNVATPVNIIHPQPGITCALATHDSGTAMSCWKD